MWCHSGGPLSVDLATPGAVMATSVESRTGVSGQIDFADVKPKYGTEC